MLLYACFRGTHLVILVASDVALKNKLWLCGAGRQVGGVVGDAGAASGARLHLSGDAGHRRNLWGSCHVLLLRRQRPAQGDGGARLIWHPYCPLSLSRILSSQCLQSAWLPPGILSCFKLC